MTKPLEDRYKCNVEGDFFEQKSSFGIGMCLRDECCHFLSGQTLWFNGSIQAQEVEAMRLLETLRRRVFTM